MIFAHVDIFVPMVAVGIWGGHQSPGSFFARICIPTRTHLNLALIWFACAYLYRSRNICIFVYIWMCFFKCFFSLHIFVYSSNVASQQEPIWSWPWYGLPVHICSVPNISHTFYIYMCFLIFCKYLYICKILHQELIWTWPWYGFPA